MSYRTAIQFHRCLMRVKSLRSLKGHKSVNDASCHRYLSSSFGSIRSFSSSGLLFLDGQDPDPSMVNSLNAPSNFVPSCAVVYRNVISTEIESILIQEIKKRMKRRRYEKGHFDGVIVGYKEVELSDISFPSTTTTSNITSQIQQDSKENFDDNLSETIIPHVFETIRHHLLNRHLLVDDDKPRTPISWLPCHAIDLKKNGELKAHVDSIRFSGDLVSGLSLRSPSIMRLKLPTDGDDEFMNKTSDGNSSVDINNKEGYIDLYLPPRSLYALTGVGRYDFSHELLPDNSTFVNPINGDETVVSRDHRLSIIFRDAKQ